MSTTQLDRHAARRRTRIAGAVGSALLLGGLWYGAWAIVNDRAPASAASILAGAAADVPKPAPIRTVSTSVDLPAAGSNLARIANRPVPPPPPVPVNPTGPVEQTRPAMSVRFLGVIAEADRLLALIHAGGRQRVVGRDALIPADTESATLLKVKEVTREAIVLLDGSKEIRVERSARTGPAVSYVAAGPALAGSVMVPPYQPTGAPYNPAGTSGLITSSGQPLSPMDRMREAQRRGEMQRNLMTGVPEVKSIEAPDAKVIAGDATGESESDGVPPPTPPLGVPKAVPVPPDGDKPK